MPLHKQRCCAQLRSTTCINWTSSSRNEAEIMHTTSWKLWLAVACLALAGPVRAQPLPVGLSLPPSLNFATSPSPVGSGARAVGRGTAFIGVADDATAASHNPGGLVQLQRPEVSVVGSYFLRFEQQDVARLGTVVENQTLHELNLHYPR